MSIEDDLFFVHNEGRKSGMNFGLWLGFIVGFLAGAGIVLMVV